MRKSIVFITLLIGLLLIVGCSAEGKGNDQNVEKENQENQENNDGEVADENEYPKTIEVNGQSVTLEKRPERILPLSLDAAEIVLELVDPSRVVATTEGIDNPALSTQTEKGAKIENKIPSMAAINIDPEQIMSYDTDLLIFSRTQGENEDAINVLVNQDIPVLSLPTVDSIDRLTDFILTIGEAIGEKDNAAILVNELEETIADIQADIPDVEEKPTVLFLTEIYAGSGAYMGVGNIAYDLIEYAGAVPAVDMIGLETTTEASVEQVIKMDPDYIFFRDFQGNGEQAYEELMSQPGWDTLKAVKNGNVQVIPTYFTGSNTKLTEGLRTMVETIYGSKE